MTCFGLFSLVVALTFFQNFPRGITMLQLVFFTEFVETLKSTARFSVNSVLMEQVLEFFVVFFTLDFA